MSVRKATHGGSWYSDSQSKLDSQLSSWLATAAKSSAHGPAKAIISPHAGYSYSGPVAGFAYQQIDPESVERVFVLGPSHHFYLAGCALSRCETYATPLGDLRLDRPLIAELRGTGEFEEMSLRVDEEEHSIELQLPYIRKVMGNRPFTLVPILVGSLSTEREAHYGQLLSKYLADPRNLFVISSDFCHWGSRFNYTFADKRHGAIHESIEHLDRQGMSLIEQLDAPGFATYLKKYRNTICGRHPIAVLLHAVRHATADGSLAPSSLKFLQYAQSSAVTDERDSSVSYAAASLVVP